MKEKPQNITFHYTNAQMVKDLIAITPIGGSVLDAGSGKNKVWFNNLSGEKYECEIEDGNDFMNWNKKVDWTVGNPPFSESWKFTEKAMAVSNKGIAWLLNNQAFNSHFTPKRLQLMKDKGFTLKKIRVVSDKRWFGRYYYLVFTKGKNNFISWERKSY
jgi:hypothetical protein